MNTFSFLLCIVWVGVSFAQPLTLEQKNSDLRQLADLVKSSYGPLQLKEETLHIDVDQLLARYTRKAEKLNNLSFYYLLNQFVAEFQDSHFGTRLKSDHVSFLGFLTDRIQGKVLIDQIDTDLLPPETFPFEPGDEIVTFDGKPVMEVVRNLGTYIGGGYIETELRSASMLLAYRPSTSVPPQTGKVTLSIRSRESGKLAEITMPWRQKGGPVEESSEWGAASLKTDYMNISIDDYYAALPKAEKSFLCSPKTRIDPPEGATVFMTEPFVAYYYPTPKGNVGYLRIPHYDWGDSVEKTRYEQYEWAIYKLEAKTVGLIIDQDHNCGGKIDFLENIVRLFANKPFLGVQFEFLANRNEYFNFKDYAENATEHTLGALDMSNILTAVKTAWQHGDFLTEKITLQGNRMLQPSSVHYSHPIIILTDEMSGSGGDAFPALMQGMGRAKVLGNRTMGAGGNVVEAGSLNYSGNTVRLTKSLFFHPNGQPIENKGVTPDYPYQPTVYDFVNGYECYRKFYTAKLLSLIDSASAPTAAAASVGLALAGSPLTSVLASGVDPNCPVVQ